MIVADNTGQRDRKLATLNVHVKVDNGKKSLIQNLLSTIIMAKEMVPIYAVKSQDFVERTVEKLDLRYEIPSRKYFSKTTIFTQKHVTE